MAKESVRMSGSRYDELKKMLGDRRREVHGEIQERVRASRSEGALRVADKARDMGDDAEADMRDDIEFALTQMKADTVRKIDEALVRLEEGSYGNCADCRGEIAEKRLRALPFVAVRCKDCEEAREVAAARERAVSSAHNRWADESPLFR